jgi:hypothetical protein
LKKKRRTFKIVIDRYSNNDKNKEIDEKICKENGIQFNGKLQKKNSLKVGLMEGIYLQSVEFTLIIRPCLFISQSIPMKNTKRRPTQT